MATITQDGAAINYIKDARVTITAAGADDGNKVLANRTLGDTIAFLCDDVEIEFENRDEDHSQGQAVYEHMRLRKKSQSIRINRKLEVNDALAALLAANDVVVITILGTTTGIVPEPFNLTGALAKVMNVSSTLGAPSTMRASFGSYGVAFV